MQSKITTMLRSGILDKQGKAVKDVLTRLGFEGILNVRIGKEYFIEHTKDCDMDRVAKAVYNEVMEDYTAEEITHDNPSNPKNTQIE
jgi:phosphoribosylformylglycinamidine synthase